MDDLVSVSFIVGLPSLNTVRIFRLCNNSTVYAAELTAIMETVYGRFVPGRFVPLS